VARNDFPLRDAPEKVFDQTQWAEFVSRMGGRQEALLRISRKEPGIIAFYRQEIAKGSGLDGHRARQKEEIAVLGNTLVAGFVERLAREEIIASGLSSVAIERKEIPAERWSDLWPNFAEDQAEGKELTFTKVRVFEAAGLRTSQPSRFDQCVSWMRERQLAGEQLRKVLAEEALQRFEPPLTTREFGAAYKTVFGRLRGRPRKADPE
jgi:hypothetical protein